MATRETMNVGVVGARRGSSFLAALAANGARVHAVCDISTDALNRFAREAGASETYTDYDKMLDKSDLHAVVVGTPMPLHVPQSIKAIERGLHVLSEVPAAVSVDECRALVAACRNSKAVYMMAENSAYTKPNTFIRGLARAGLFGQTYYAEGEYLHELKGLNEQTPWRRKWQTGIEGVTYPTHSLGPILQWMQGDRVTRVCCEGSGHHYRDPRGDAYHQDGAVMLCKTARGALIKIRVDMISDRPHAMSNYQLQGTDGVYESSRGGPGEKGKIWLRELSADIRWFDLDEAMAPDALGGRCLPDGWLNPSSEALAAGHGGGDFFQVVDFLAAARGETTCPIGVHEAMDMTLPGLISQQSAVQGGAWLSVPDSRQWTDGPPQPQLQMVMSPDRLDSLPGPNAPDGYVLRQYRDADQDSYLDLIEAVGFGRWDRERLDRVRHNVLPGGFFVVEHQATGRIVASALAQHSPAPLHPEGGQLGWVGTDTTHRGKNLGTVVSAAATARMARAGYRRVYLQTDDWRLPAIRIYLKLGYEPFLYAPGMAERWQAVREKLESARG